MPPVRCVLRTDERQTKAKATQLQLHTATQLQMQILRYRVEPQKVVVGVRVVCCWIVGVFVCYFIVIVIVMSSLLLLLLLVIRYLNIWDLGL